MTTEDLTRSARRELELPTGKHPAKRRPGGIAEEALDFAYGLYMWATQRLANRVTSKWTSGQDHQG